ncbi:hypothetical protein MKW98_000828 [Papaver atlanticum]|uniref:Uncharacterized protein n=1 Tax=Papaver atlanticum TaxID=357466 RepID=A0AAD4XBM1_9MAGN|nr:hypothetical protein MKW98_000828 [Papaver atlanticum]
MEAAVYKGLLLFNNIEENFFDALMALLPKAKPIEVDFLAKELKFEDRLLKLQVKENMDSVKQEIDVGTR